MSCPYPRLHGYLSAVPNNVPIRQQPRSRQQCVPSRRARRRASLTRPSSLGRPPLVDTAPHAFRRRRLRAPPAELLHAVPHVVGAEPDAPARAQHARHARHDDVQARGARVGPHAQGAEGRVDAARGCVARPARDHLPRLQILPAPCQRPASHPEPARRVPAHASPLRVRPSVPAVCSLPAGAPGDDGVRPCFSSRISAGGPCLRSRSGGLVSVVLCSPGRYLADDHSGTCTRRRSSFVA